MKDLPITLRVAILVGLFLSLIGTMSQFVVGPAKIPQNEGVSTSDGGGEVKPVLREVMLYPSVPADLPDLNEGYLFNEERQLEELDLDTASGAGEAVDLAEVTYAGSVIIGETHKGLVSYQEERPVRKLTIKTTRRGGRTRKTSTKVIDKYKQLELGDNFLGYLVTKIAIDRIVFKKGSEVVEKFLFDPDKERIAAGTAVKTKSPKSARSLPESVGRGVQQVPVRRTVSSASRATGKETNVRSKGVVAPTDSDSSSAAAAIKKRSELLLGLDPSLGVVPSLGVPRDPLRR